MKQSNRIYHTKKAQADLASALSALRHGRKATARDKLLSVKARMSTVLRELDRGAE